VVDDGLVTVSGFPRQLMLMKLNLGTRIGAGQAPVDDLSGSGNGHVRVDGWRRPTPCGRRTCRLTDPRRHRWNQRRRVRDLLAALGAATTNRSMARRDARAFMVESAIIRARSLAWTNSSQELTTGLRLQPLTIAVVAVDARRRAPGS
jgi:hypothetical protein